MKKYIFVLCSFFLTMGLLSSCKKEAKGTDKELFDMAKSTANFTFYKNSDALLPKSSGTGHSELFLKTRYNTIAASFLDANGKIVAGSQFAEGSVIVKELYKDANTLSRYAVLYKNATNGNADAKGWVWGYINADGTVATSSSSKGDGCIGCHSQTGNIDYMLMNKYFP